MIIIIAFQDKNLTAQYKADQVHEMVMNSVMREHSDLCMLAIPQVSGLFINKMETLFFSLNILVFSF